MQSISRNPRITFTQRSIEKIKNGRLLDNLMKYCNGKLELTGKQVDCHLRLINKVLPDLQSVQHDVSINNQSLNMYDLNARLASLGHDPEAIWSRLSTNKPLVIEHDPISTSDSIDAIDSVETSDSINTVEKS